jgi:hypothetical protein
MASEVVVESEQYERALAYLRWLWADGDVREVRALHGSGRWTAAGVYATPEEAAAAAVEQCERGAAPGVYVTLNPVRLAPREMDRIGAGEGAKDADVTRRTHLLIDVDPTRPSGVSSSRGEREVAASVAREIRATLSAAGWPEPSVLSSGNGWHLVYKIDLPNDEVAHALVRRVLVEVARRWDTDSVKVDRSVHNAARITRIAGTRARKGAATEERPHREARVMGVGGGVVSREALEALAPEPVATPLPLEAPLRAASVAPAGTAHWTAGDAEDAIWSVSPEAYQDWIAVGAACRAVWGEAGWGTWHRWSQMASSYEGEASCARKWTQLPDGGSEDDGIRAICGMARAAGWARPSAPISQVRRQVQAAGVPAQGVGVGVGAVEVDGTPPDLPCAASGCSPSGHPAWSHTWGAGAGQVTGTLGEVCAVVTCKVSEATGEVREEARIVAHDIWPVAEYVDEEGKAGLYVEYVTRFGRVGGAAIPAGDLVEARGHREAVKRLAEAGARVSLMGGVGVQLGGLLGAALDQMGGARRGVLVSRCGWHGESYLAGQASCGEGDLLWDSTCEAIRRRDGLKGTAEQWRREVSALCTTHGLMAAVACSLAGAVIRKRGITPFIVHLAGPGSCGKSSAAWVAASVWGAPDVGGALYTWDSTPKAIEGLAYAMTDACLVLDELGRWSGREGELAGLVHTLGGSGGRARLELGGDLKRLKEYYCTTLSTGEVEVARKIGAGIQAGHLVRCLDVPISVGEVATDGAHADELKARSALLYGAAGRAWVEALVARGALELVGYQSEVHRDTLLATHKEAAGGEARRVVGSIALMAACLDAAREAGVVDAACFSEERVAAWAAWMTRRIVVRRAERRQSTPDERALDALLSYVAGDEARAPHIDGMGRQTGLARDAVGVREGGQLWIAERWLRNTGVVCAAGVTERAWLTWLTTLKAADGSALAGKSKRTIGEHVGARWTWLDLEAAEAYLGADQEEV